MWFSAPSAFVLVLASSVLGRSINTAITEPSNMVNVSSIEVFNGSSIEMVNASYIGELGPPPTCTRARTFLRFYYKVGISNVPDSHPIPGVCENLWRGLKYWGACAVSSPHGCGTVAGGNNNLEWWFHTSGFCNKGMVENAFWRATWKGAWGNVKCIEI